jgi:hypothetical protein
MYQRRRRRTMTEAKARNAIIDWAESYFCEEEKVAPTVTIVRLDYDQEEEEWTAELEVSTSADNPTVTFWMDERFGLQVPIIEY